MYTHRASSAFPWFAVSWFNLEEVCLHFIINLWLEFEAWKGDNEERARSSLLLCKLQTGVKEQQRWKEKEVLLNSMK